MPLSELVEPMYRVFQLFYQSRSDGDIYPGYSLGNPAEDIISDDLEVDGYIEEDIHAELKAEFNDFYEMEVTYNDDYVYKRTDFTSGLLEKIG